MPITPAISLEQASEPVRKLYDEILAALAVDDVPLDYKMMGQVAPFLDDSFHNFRHHVKAGDDTLNAMQREAIVLATSLANNCRSCVKVHATKCRKLGYTDQQVSEIFAVTADCAMHNTLARLTDLADHEALRHNQPPLQSKTSTATTLSPQLVSLIQLVVSGILGSRSSVQTYLAQAIDHGVTTDQIRHAARISAVMTAFNVYFRAQ